MPPPCFQRPWRSISWVGAPFCGHATGHAHPPAVAAETLPVGKTSGLGDYLHPPGDLRLRQPEYLLLVANARRSDGFQRFHGGGSDGHHGALGFGVGLGADHGDAAAAVVPALGVSPGKRRRLGTTQPPVGQHGHQGQVEAGALGGLLKRFEAAAAGFRSGEPNHGQHVGGEGTGLALGLDQPSPPSFQGGADARVPAGGFVAGPLVDLGDGATRQAHSSDAGAGTGADGQVAGHDEGFRRQGRETHRVAPFVEQPPLDAVDAAGVVGEDGLQGGGDALVGRALMAGNDAGWRRTICGSLAAVVMGVSSWAISAGIRCAIRLIIARRTDVGNSFVEVLSGVVRLALIAGVG